MSFNSKQSISANPRKSNIAKSASLIIKATSPESFLDRMVEEDETHSFIVSIKDELIESALKKCYERYLEQASVSFILHCLEKAWLQLINFQFMYHDVIEQNVEIDVSFKPAVPPEPSPPDTWAYHSIPISKNLDDDQGYLFEEPVETNNHINDFSDETKDTKTTISIFDEPSIIQETSLEEESFVEDEEIIDEGSLQDIESENKSESGSIFSDVSFFKNCIEAQKDELPSIPWNCWPKDISQKDNKITLQYASSKIIRSYSNKIVADNSSLPPIRLRSKIFSQTTALERRLKTSSRHNAKSVSKSTISASSYKSD